MPQQVRNITRGRKLVAIRLDTHKKLVRLARRQRTTLGEVIRYLVELADQGKVRVE